MTYYSRYRRLGMSNNTKYLLCALCVCILWCFANEMDYLEVTQTVCYQEAA